MKYSDLQRAMPSGTIDLGRGRAAPARMLSPAEDAAIRRAIPEPEAPVMKTPKGEPMVDGHGRLVRDDGSPEYNARAGSWYRRYTAARIAVAIGLESSEGIGWNRAKLNDPAEGLVKLGGDKIASAFEEAERARRAYCVSVAQDILGRDSSDGLLTVDELDKAMEQYKKIGFAELVAESAEGNSGSAQGADQAASPTHG